jgi:hypothetical protein
MQLKFIKMLQNVDYQALIDRAIEEVTPYAIDMPDQSPHLVRNVIITTHLEDYELGAGLEVSFELQNPVPRYATIEGRNQKIFYRQFVAFIPQKEIVYLDEVKLTKKVKRSITDIIPKFLDKIYRKIPG